MSAFQFTVNEDLPLSFEPFLFNQHTQLLTQSKDLFLFQLKKGQLCYAIFPCFIKEKEAVSPLRAPFGSIEFDETIGYEELSFFIERILEFIRQKDIDSVTIVSYPECYSYSKSQLLSFLLWKNNFHISIKDLNYHLPVNASFENHLHDSELRRLKKSIHKNFQPKVGKLEHLHEMYSLIKACRQRKGFPLSTTFEVLENLFEQFPENYISFTIWDSDVLIACSIGVLVSKDILYYFLPADHHEYLSFSPTVLLLKTMYDYCLEYQIALFDLGIATSGGVLNEGLIRFKENVGGIPSLKISYKKIF